MQQTNKTRGVQLLRTDDSTPGKVKFYDRRQEDVTKAFIAEVDVTKLSRDALLRAAVHGLTQNILDASNKLEGDARVKYVKDACRIVQDGGWASAPVDEEKLRENALAALMKLGLNKEAALAAINAPKKA
jgi:hypothetical protein